MKANHTAKTWLGVLLNLPLAFFELTMSESVSFTWFLCCACHDRCEGSAFFGTHRAVELHISHIRGCQAACKGIKSVPVVYRDSQWLDHHEAGTVGAPGHWQARPVVTGSSAGASGYPNIHYFADILHYRVVFFTLYIDIYRHVVEHRSYFCFSHRYQRMFLFAYQYVG